VTRLARFAIAAACAVTACGGSSSPAPASPTPPPAPTPAAPTTLAFTVSPIDPALLQEITPLGSMNPWGHTLPTDHLYFSHHFNVASFPPVTLVAPAAGTVESVIDRGGGDHKITVRVGSGFVYAIDHVNLKAGFGSGTAVQAGQELGTSTSGVFDLGVANLGRTLGFLNPARYSRESLYADSPLRYFDEPLRSTLYAKVRRTGTDLDGRIDYDAAGTLAGNWFAADLPPEQSSIGGDMSVGTRQLSFARDVYAPDRLRVSIGGLGMTGVWAVQPGAPDFAAITPASGLVVYRLFATGEPGGPEGTQQIGWLLAQLLEGGRLQVEAVSGAGPSAPAFGPNAVIYVR
jgi:hypothetical protein